MQKYFDDTMYMLPENLHYVILDSDIYEGRKKHVAHAKAKDEENSEIVLADEVENLLYYFAYALV